MGKFFSVVVCGLMLALITSGTFAAEEKKVDLSDMPAIAKAIEKSGVKAPPDKVTSITAKGDIVSFHTADGVTTTTLTADQKALLVKELQAMKDNQAAQTLLAGLQASTVLPRNDQAPTATTTATPADTKPK